MDSSRTVVSGAVLPRCGNSESSHSSSVWYFNQVDNLTQHSEVDQGTYVGDLKDITRGHWKPTEQSTTCTNRSCRKSFSTLLERPHHCRRCGDVFCADCVRYQRRLNNLAHFDPNGRMQKVCKACFHKDKLTEGQARSHTADFKRLRALIKKHESVNGETADLPSRWRARLNMDRECQRILNGFEYSFGTSEIMKTLHSLRTMVSKPDWMKTSVRIQENLSIKCQFCGKSFGLLRKKCFCTVCGIALCKACSSTDLLVYFPDDDDDKGSKSSSSAKLGIIKIVGCPEMEPEVSLYLRVCDPCKDRLVDKQVREVTSEDEEADVSRSSSFLDLLNRVNDRFVKAEERVREQLPKYREIVESLEDGSRNTSNQSQSNMKLLAKAQGDLADVLANHVTVVQQLKKLQPHTDKQSTLLKMYIRAKCEFYLENMSQFRSLTHKLGQSVPAECLDFIQKVMDKNAIISTHLYIRQLVYETIHLCDKFAIENALPGFLMGLEQKIESDVEISLKENKEDLEEHFSILMDMIRIRMKENKLIRPSKTALKRRGSLHVRELMNIRTEAILNQVNAQLQLASALRSFPTSKGALEEALAGLDEIRKVDEKEMADFVLL